MKNRKNEFKKSKIYIIKYMSNNSAGRYSVSVSFSLPWKKETPKKILGDVKKRRKTLKPILYPVFENFSNLTEDEFWKSIFMDCARGKFPRGFIFKNNLLIHKKGSKLTQLELSNSTTDVFVSTMNFFQMTAGIMSVLDRQKINQREEEKIIKEMKKDSELTWGYVKKEGLKEVLINEFITDICEKMNFTEKEKKELITTIKKGLMLKCFNSNNIIMSGGRIKEIDGLFYNEDTKEYEIDENYIPRKNSIKNADLGIEKEIKKPEINFLEIWKKYLENLGNKKNNRNTSVSFSVTQTDDDFSKTQDTY